MLPVYVGSVLVLIGWLIAQQLVRDADNRVAGRAARPVRQPRRQRPHRVLDDLRAQPQAGAARGRAALEPAALARHRRGHRRPLLLALLVRRGRRRAAAASAARPWPTRPTARRRSPTGRPLRIRAAGGRAPGAGGRLAAPAAPHLARVPRDDEEHLLRRARARRPAVPGLRQHHRRRSLRHQHLAGDLPDARPALRQLRRVHADHHRLLRRRAGLARARQPPRPDQRRAADADLAAAREQARRADAGARGAAARADALRHGDPGGQGLHPLRARASTCTTCSPSTW